MAVYSAVHSVAFGESPNPSPALTTWLTIKCSFTRMDFSYEASIPFPSSKEATIVANSLNADAELRAESVLREIAVEDNTIKVGLFSPLCGLTQPQVKFQATEAKLLKSAVGTFLSLAALSADTIDAFAL